MATNIECFRCWQKYSKNPYPQKILKETRPKILQKCDFSYFPKFCHIVVQIPGCLTSFYSITCFKCVQIDLIECVSKYRHILGRVYTTLYAQMRIKNFGKTLFLGQKLQFFENRQISKWPISGRVTQNDKKTIFGRPKYI